MTNVIGIDLGATNLRVALANEKGELKDFRSQRTDSRKITEQIFALLDNYSGYEGIGIGSMGPIDYAKGMITIPPNVNIRNLRIVDILEKKYAVKCTLLNDCMAGVYGEKKFGAGKSVKSLVYLTLSTGIGGGIIDNDRLVLGKDGNASEIGHTGIDSDLRLKCGCGSSGRHWQAYTAGMYIPEFARRLIATKYAGEKSSLTAKLEKLTALDVFEAVGSDKIAKQIVEEDMGRVNASGISNIINAYDPQLITIGGSVALNNEQLILGPIKRHIKDYAINKLPEIRLTPLKKDVVISGAAAYVLDSIKN